MVEFGTASSSSTSGTPGKVSTNHARATTVTPGLSELKYGKVSSKKMVVVNDKISFFRRFLCGSAVAYFLMEPFGAIGRRMMRREGAVITSDGKSAIERTEKDPIEINIVINGANTDSAPPVDPPAPPAAPSLLADSATSAGDLKKIQDFEAKDFVADPGFFVDTGDANCRCLSFEELHNRVKLVKTVEKHYTADLPGRTLLGGSPNAAYGPDMVVRWDPEPAVLDDPKWKDGVGNQTFIELSAYYGTFCNAWDLPQAGWGVSRPEMNCPDPKTLELDEYCTNKFCYVDPCRCTMLDKQRTFMFGWQPAANSTRTNPHAETGKFLVHSYNTCARCEQRTNEKQCRGHTHCEWKKNKCGFIEAKSEISQDESSVRKSEGAAAVGSNQKQTYMEASCDRLTAAPDNCDALIMCKFDKTTKKCVVSDEADPLLADHWGCSPQQVSGTATQGA